MNSRKLNSKAQISHTFVILFGLLLITLTATIFSNLEEKITDQDFLCEHVLDDVHSEVIFAHIYSSKYTSYERTISIPDTEVLFSKNKISCGQYSRESNINTEGLGSFREGLHLIK